MQKYLSLGHAPKLRKTILFQIAALHPVLTVDSHSGNCRFSRAVHEKYSFVCGSGSCQTPERLRFRTGAGDITALPQFKRKTA